MTQEKATSVAHQLHNPFVWVSLIWAVISTIGLLLIVSPGQWFLAALGFYSFWFLTLLDLFSITKVVASLLNLMSDSANSSRTKTLIQLAFWGTLKLTCLIGLGLGISKAEGLPLMGLLMGLGTLIVVPLAGGFWWTRFEVRKGDEHYAW